jgi:hypothetical protein
MRVGDQESLPCPFCGCDPMPDYCSTNDGPAYLFHCQSKDCPAWPSAQGDTEAEAIAAWNTRSTPDRNAVPTTYAPTGLEYAAVDQNDMWCLRFADQDCGDQWFGGEGYTAEETREAAIEAWNRYAPAWSVRLMRTVTLDEVRALTTTPEPTDPAGVSEMLYEARELVLENALATEAAGTIAALLEALDLARGAFSEMVRYGYAHCGEVTEGSEGGFYLGKLLTIVDTAVARARGQ